MEDEDDIKKLNDIITIEKNETPDQNINNYLMEFDEYPQEIYDSEESGSDEDNFNCESEVEHNFQENHKSCIEYEPDLLESDSKLTVKFSIPSLTAEEQNLFDKCKQQKLKQLMILNRTKNNHLISMYNRIVLVLKMCHEKINEEIRTIKNSKSELIKVKRYDLWKLSCPYFKDNNFSVCPCNTDTEQKRINNEITIPYIVTVAKWTQEDKKLLERGVILNYLCVREKQLIQKMQNIKAEINKGVNANVEVELKDKVIQIENQLKMLKHEKDSEVPPLHESVLVNWELVASKYLNDRHTPRECKVYWNVFLHPSINKSKWTVEENKQILSLAQKYDFQDWEGIARELNNNRTGFSTCVHFYSNLCDKFKKHKFLPEEDEFLIDVVSHCRAGNHISWKKVAYYFQDRSKFQLYHRYRYYLEKKVTFGPFTIAEDILLICLMEKFGALTKCAEYFPNRSYVQIKSRYVNYLQNLDLHLGDWLKEEDLKILKHVKKCGDKNWGGLTKEMRRTRATIRQRYRTLCKWLDKNPNKSIDEMPRKTHPHLNKLRQKYNYLKLVAEKFKRLDYIPSIEMINDSLHLRNYVSAAKNVDTHLIEFFKNSYDFGAETTVNQNNYIRQSANSINNILNVLGTELNIPDEELLTNNPKLDKNDVDILLLLKEKNQTKINNGSKKYSSFVSLPSTSKVNPTLIPKPEKVKALIPPHLDSLVGLRCALLHYGRSPIKKVIMTDSLTQEIDVTTKQQEECEKELFLQRFYSMFKWPCIMSIIEPNKNLIAKFSESKDKDSFIDPLQAKKKAGRPSKEDRLRKIKKMVDSKTYKNEKTNGNKLVKQKRNANGVSKASSSRYQANKVKIVNLKNSSLIKQKPKENCSRKTRSARGKADELTILNKFNLKKIDINDLPRILDDNVGMSQVLFIKNVEENGERKRIVVHRDGVYESSSSMETENYDQNSSKIEENNCTDDLLDIQKLDNIIASEDKTIKTYSNKRKSTLKHDIQNNKVLVLNSESDNMSDSDIKCEDTLLDIDSYSNDSNMSDIEYDVDELLQNV